jgi:sec-independent protein translocase protein TatB
MFDVSWSELLLIAVVALVFIGPKELPSVLRAIGQWSGKIRRMASEFQDQFREAIREAEVADLKKDIDEATSNLNTGLDPFAGTSDSAEWKHSEPTASPVPAADAPPAPPAEAIAPVAPDPVAAESAPAEPAPAVPAPAPGATESAAAAPTTSAPKSPASGDQAA